jgi:hypothetical protein
VRGALASIALGLALASPAAAHDIERAEALLGEIAEHRRAAADAPTEAERAEGLFRLAETTESLLEAVNQDVIAHGSRDLFAELVVKRLQANALNVAWAPRQNRYLYDLAAFRDYLRRAPGGPRAAEAKFRLIARSFYATLGSDPAALVGTDVAGLLRAVADEERFVREHPTHERAATVRFFLAVDQYRLARNVSEPLKRREYEGRARQALQQTVERSAEAFEVRAAQTLLETLRHP